MRRAPEDLHHQVVHLVLRHPGQPVQRPSVHEEESRDPPRGVVELPGEPGGPSPVQKRLQDPGIPLPQSLSHPVQNGSVPPLGSQEPVPGPEEVLLGLAARHHLLVHPEGQPPEEEMLGKREVPLLRAP